jgi:hypothetical protein
MKTKRLMLYREIVAVPSEIHTKEMCGQNTEFLNVKRGGTYSDRGKGVAQLVEAQR